MRVDRGAPLVGVALLIAIYGFDVGHGFVKDDFNWILTSRVDSAGELGRLMDAATGFFRPVVSLSFALDHALFGLHPLGYGLTNLALLLACVAVLRGLLRALGYGREITIAAALAWALNFQGINMAVLWISGRTALLVTLFAASSAWAWTRGARLSASLLAIGAMWSKEEGYVVPAVLTAWSLIDERQSVVSAFRRTWPLWLGAAVSLALRTGSGAFTPASAPEAYGYQFEFITLAANGLAYLDRMATTPVVTALVFWLATGLPRLRAPAGRAPANARSLDTARLSENVRSKDRASKGAIWVLLSLAPTIFLPVRSSLYAVLPSVGVILIVGDFVERMTERARPAALKRATLVVALLFVALVPIYRSRNARYVAEAELSAAIVGELSRIAAAHPAGGLVVIKDVRDARPTAEQAFGPLADHAALLATNGRLQLWIDPPPAELASAPSPDLGAPIASLVVAKGALGQTSR